jgi:cytoskeletal protein RodZ
VTLLTPFKQITALKLSKLPIFKTVEVEQLQLPQAAAIVLADSPAAAQIIPHIDPDPIPLSPREVLAQVGFKLREWREHYELSIEDISARTQIQPRLIQAIEDGQVEMLPEWVYVKGMVKRYADNLGLDGTEISQHIISWTPVATKPTVIAKQKSSFVLVAQVKPLHVYFGYMVAICGIGAGSSHLLNNAVKPTATPISRHTIQSQRSIVVAPVAVQLPDVKIGIAVKAPTWAEIGIDGTTKFTGSLKAGTQFNWTAKKQVTINTNNAGGLLFSRDGQPLKALGEIGQKQAVTIKVGN